MKLFAIRDRLIDHFRQPFTAHTVGEVQSAVAAQLNTGDALDWQQAPHHFELWELAEVTEKGHITETRVLICTLDSLVRRRIREGEPAPGGTPPP